MKLTKKALDAITYQGGTDYRWDDALPGFGVRVYPNGKKYFLVSYRVGGRKRFLSLGRYGVLTLDQARERARQTLAEVTLGDDPGEIRRDRKRAPTVAALAERYLEEHAHAKKKPSSAKTDERLLRLYILPALGKRRATDITLEQVSTLHYELRGKPTQANRVLALLSKMFNLAERWGLRPLNSNPCRHVERFKEQKSERFLSAAELGRLGEVIAQAEAEQREHPSALLAIRLLILTGARRNEILELKWEHVDFEKSCLRLPDSKTGQKVIRLGAPALQMLVAAPRQKDNEHVCAGYRKGQRLVGLQRPWDRIRTAAGLDGVRLHDLRHTHAAFAAGAGIGLPIIGRLLGHTQPATTARYAHLADDPLREAAERISGELAAAMDGLGGR